MILGNFRSKKVAQPQNTKDNGISIISYLLVAFRPDTYSRSCLSDSRSRDWSWFFRKVLAFYNILFLGCLAARNICSLTTPMCISKQGLNHAVTSDSHLNTCPSPSWYVGEFEIRWQMTNRNYQIVRFVVSLPTIETCLWSEDGLSMSKNYHPVTASNLTFLRSNNSCVLNKSHCIPFKINAIEKLLIG